jgi:hypothetical protein
MTKSDKQNNKNKDVSNDKNKKQNKKVQNINLRTT